MTTITMQVSAVKKVLSDSIIEDAEKSMKKHPELRFGQAVFNEAYKSFPEFTDRLRGTEYDCFYVDDKVGAFLEELTDIIWSEAGK